MLDDTALFDCLSIDEQTLFFVLVNGSHGSLDEASCESCHVRDGAVNEEFFDDLLVGENLDKPKRQSDVLRERFANNFDQKGDLCSVVCSEGHRQSECDDVLQNFKLVVIRVLPWLMHDLQVLAPCSIIVVVNLEDVAFEDLQTLVEKLTIEYESRQPEPLVFLKDVLVDSRWDLDLTVDCEWQTASVEEVVRCTLVGVLALVLGNNAIVICELVEFLLVDETQSLINQNVGVFCLIAPLVVDDLLHRWVMLVLFELCFPVLVLSTESLLRDLFWIKVHDLSVIELVPL